ncbi:YdcF family protein [Amycolatopsis sp. cg5]|uniref:YdcF family protein n=1 Tax=Amycolatopsis sp. cg5 TaxID=3238802 RepID=UPI003524E255
MNRKTLVGLGFFGVVCWGEFVHWRASRALTRGRLPARTEAVLVLGYRNPGERVNVLNRWRVRAALRSVDPALASTLVCSGGPSEAKLMADYAATLGFTGEVELEEESRSTWQNVEYALPLIEHAEQIKIVSNPLHGQKARLYLRELRPDLAERLVRAADYRLGEAWPVKPLFALYGLRDLAGAKRKFKRD